MHTGRHPTLNHSRGFSHITLYLMLTYVVLLVYGTLFPFNEWLTPSASPWTLMWQHRLYNASKADMLTNLLVYMPLGLLLMRTLTSRRCSLRTVLLVTLASALVSLTLEYLQAHLPSRVPSFADVVLNTCGGFAGALLALGMRPDTAIGEKLYRIRFRYIQSGPLANLGLLTLCLWTLSQISPLVPSIDLGNLRHGLSPLWQTLINPATPGMGARPGICPVHHRGGHGEQHLIASSVQGAADIHKFCQSRTVVQDTGCRSATVPGGRARPRHRSDLHGTGL